MGTRHLIHRRVFALIALVGCLVVLTGCATLFVGTGSLQSGLDSPGKRAYISIVFRCIPTSPADCNTGVALGDLGDAGSNATFPNGVHLKFDGIMEASNNPGKSDNCMSATLNYTVTKANAPPTLSSIGALSNPDQLPGGIQTRDGTVSVFACAHIAEISVLTGPYKGYYVSGPLQGNFIAGRV